MYSGKSACIRAKVVVLVQKLLYLVESGYVREKWYYSGKVVVFGQTLFYTDRSGSIRAKVVVFGQSSCIRAKVVVIGQKWIYLEKSGSIRAKIGSIPAKRFV